MEENTGGGVRPKPTNVNKHGGDLDSPADKRSGLNRNRANSLETPLSARKSESLRDFSGFKDERNNSRKIMALEKDVIILKAMVSELLGKQEIHERLMKENTEIKETLEKMRDENEKLKGKCDEYETAIREMKDKVSDSANKVEEAISDSKLEDIKSAWKKEVEKDKISFREVVQKQIEEKTKNTVIQVIQEKKDMVKDAIEKKKCLVIYGLTEKKNPVKYTREKEEKELVKKVVKEVQGEDLDLEREIEEVYRIGKYSEERKRPLKVKLRSQVVVDEILSKTGKLATREEYKEVWIKRDMILEEREKERELRREAKEKNEERTETDKGRFYWRVLDMKLKKWYIKKQE